MHKETRQRLDTWANSDGKTLLFSKFFFWRLGSKDQKSMHGLIAGLVYDALYNLPSLAPVMFPRLWSPRGVFARVGSGVGDAN